MVLALLPLLIAPSAHARSEAAELFCETYADAPACSTGSVSCTTCHGLSGPPSHNPYGSDVSAAYDELTADEKAAWISDSLTGVSLVSDGFLPFRDNIDHAARQRFVDGLPLAFLPREQAKAYWSSKYLDTSSISRLPFYN